MRIKNKSAKSSEGDVLIAPAYRNNTLDNSISKPKEKVNKKYYITGKAFSQKLAELTEDVKELIIL